jgi:ribosomal protein L22
MTEKDYNPEQRNAKTIKKQAKATKTKMPSENKVAKKIAEAPKETEEKVSDTESQDSSVKDGELKKETKTADKKETKKPEKKIKKDFAIVNAYSLPISTKDSVAICKFIKWKSIENAMKDLEEVAKLKKPVPAKGEYAHKKGKGISSAIYPKKAALNFIRILKTLKGNANYNGIENPVIVEAVPNMASRPAGKFGRYKRKRTHLKIRVEELKVKEKKK